MSPQISANYRGANDYRPNVVPGQPLIKKSKLAGTGYIQYINYAAFQLPATKDGSGNLLSPFGNSPRNPGRTPAFYQSDLALNKKFSTPVESLKVEFRAEFYNVFNHTNLYLPSSGLGRDAAGVGCGQCADAGDGYSYDWGERLRVRSSRGIVQFGLKILY